MSPLQMLVEFEAWLETLSPAFLFLLVLPFAVGAVALAQYLIPVLREARRRVEANAVPPQAANGAASLARVGYTMPKVLVPLDGSENALRAVRHVVNQSLAKGGLEAHLLYVRPQLSWRFARFAGKKQRESRYRELADQVLGPARALLNRYSLPHAVHMESGDRADAILRAAQRLRVDKIVLGTARKNSLTRMFEDSVTSRLIENARVPVEVIAGSKISPLERFGVPAGVGTAVAAVLVAAD